MLSTLLRLLRDPATLVETVSMELDRLAREQAQPLHMLLNNGEEASKPINLAVRHTAPSVEY